MKTNKYIFLDIDGVINIHTKLDNDLQALLGFLLYKTDAKIILSSSWRMNTLEETKEFMFNNGFWFTDRIVGITIRAYHYLDRTRKVHLSIPRGVEIKQWIDANIHSDNGKEFNRKKLGVDYQYVIIDDDSDMLLEHQYNFVQTESDKGLTTKDVVKCINTVKFGVLSPYEWDAYEYSMFVKDQLHSMICVTKP